jgi:hypothetical protein
MRGDDERDHDYRPPDGPLVTLAGPVTTTVAIAFTVAVAFMTA